MDPYPIASDKRGRFRKKDMIKEEKQKKKEQEGIGTVNPALSLRRKLDVACLDRLPAGMIGHLDRGRGDLLRHLFDSILERGLRLVGYPICARMLHDLLHGSQGK